MSRILKRQIVVLGALLSLFSAGAQAANVGYYEMCYGEGRSWAITPISAAGHTPVYLADLSAADLAGLDVVFVTNCSNTTHGSEYLARLPELSTAVENGLILMIHDRRVNQAKSILPGGNGINTTRQTGRNVDVSDDTTVLTNGPAGRITNATLDDARNSEHGYVHRNSLPAKNQVVLTRPNGNQAVTLSYKHGKGSVIYSTIPLDYYAGILPVCARYSSTDPVLDKCMRIATIYAPNVVAYATELAKSVPVANAGADQSVDEGMTVTLDASVSADSSGSQLTYQWKQLSPVSPQLKLVNANTATPSFAAPYLSANMTFTFQLVVSANGTDSDPDTVDITIKNNNNPPVADAGDTFNIKAGATAQLNGANSYDPDNDAPLSYQWTQLAGPAITLNNANTATPTFDAPNMVGQSVTLELVVSDGREASTPASIIVNIVDNAAPIANAGEDMTKDEGSIVALNALASSDPDSDGLFFEWTQISGPTVELDNSGSPTPFFTAPAVMPNTATTLEFEVAVSDMDPLNPKSSSDRIIINLMNINDAPACHLAQPSLAQLWPPNHKMHPVSIHGVVDNDSVYKNVAIVITGITQDEAVMSLGGGHSSPDAIIQDLDPSDAALLRAERKGHSNGRVYQINFTASDGFESCDGSVQVTVPKSRKPKKYLECDVQKEAHDKGGKHKRKHAHGKHHKHCTVKKRLPEVIDDGQNYDATEEVARRHHRRGHHSHDVRKKIEKKLERMKKKAKEHKDKHRKHAHKKAKKHDDE